MMQSQLHCWENCTLSAQPVLSPAEPCKAVLAHSYTHTPGSIPAVRLNSSIAEPSDAEHVVCVGECGLLQTHQHPYPPPQPIDETKPTLSPFAVC